MIFSKKLEDAIVVSNEEISLFRAKEPGSILLEDEEIIEILKKKKSQQKPQTTEKSSSKAQNYQEERKEWEKFYKDHWNEKVDFSKVKIPPKPKGNWRLLFIKKGLTINQSFDKCKKLFNTWECNKNLDKVITKNSRTPTTHYAIWVKNKKEPDTQYLGKSTKDADPNMKIGVTLLERLILELKYYEETKKHLDIKGITFCTGSRFSDGDVPGVDWGGNSELVVYWFRLDASDSEGGLRRAVY